MTTKYSNDELAVAKRYEGAGGSVELRATAATDLPFGGAAQGAPARVSARYPAGCSAARPLTAALPGASYPS